MIARTRLQSKPRRGITIEMPRFEATTTVLAGGATFTSGALITDTYDTVSGVVFSDQTGTCNIEQSTDGTNWDLVTAIAVTGGTGKDINVPLVAPYFRVRYVNGATPQTVFRLRVKATAAGTR
jgi:hypothetical protein